MVFHANLTVRRFDWIYIYICCVNNLVVKSTPVLTNHMFALHHFIVSYCFHHHHQQHFPAILDYKKESKNCAMKSKSKSKCSSPFALKPYFWKGAYMFKHLGRIITNKNPVFFQRSPWKYPASPEILLYGFQGIWSIRQWWRLGALESPELVENCGEVVR